VGGEPKGNQHCKRSAWDLGITSIDTRLSLRMGNSRPPACGTCGAPCIAAFGKMPPMKRLLPRLVRNRVVLAGGDIAAALCRNRDAYAFAAPIEPTSS